MTAPAADPYARPLPRRALALGLACALAVFTAAALVAAEPPGALDRLGLGLAAPEGALWGRAARAFTRLGDNAAVTLWVVAAGAALLARRRWGGLVRLVAASALGSGVLTGLKTLFGRARPESPWLEPPGLSFPSGHAFNAAVLAVLALYLLWRYGGPGRPSRHAVALAAALAVLMAASRVVLGVHYLTDAAAGLAAGTAWALAVLLVAEALEARRTSRPARP
ncbi:MAG: phosphatase PAP2 family protein [Rubricoccaceae bacterium]